MILLIYANKAFAEDSKILKAGECVSKIFNCIYLDVRVNSEPLTLVDFGPCIHKVAAPAGVCVNGCAQFSLGGSTRRDTGWHG